MGIEPLMDGAAFDALLVQMAFGADWLFTEFDARGASAITLPRAMPETWFRLDQAAV